LPHLSLAKPAQCAGHDEAKSSGYGSIQKSRRVDSTIARKQALDFDRLVSSRSKSEGEACGLHHQERNVGLTRVDQFDEFERRIEFSRFRHLREAAVLRPLIASASGKHLDSCVTWTSRTPSFERAIRR
jgi:hypothetical protein